ncbi:MAG: NAD-binding protein [Betaproteobacteria bacterium]|nr:NAD-binding protein [Betaproteobacteria bacterium]
MGEPMCRNLALKGGVDVVAFDRDEAPLARLATHGIRVAASVAEVAAGASVVFVSLPSGEAVEALCAGDDGLFAASSRGQVIVDLGTSPVSLTRALAERFADRGVTWVDAPVARTRAAAEAGRLSVMVGADAATFARLEPMLATFATDVTLCGPTGCGQVVKILNNMVLFETVVALSEACAIGEHAGVPRDRLLDTLAKGSADSFALRNHGQKAIVPDTFPERAFSVRYARKDLGYARQLAEEAHVDARGAGLVDEWFERAIRAGLGDQYFPVISRLLKGS